MSSANYSSDEEATPSRYSLKEKKPSPQKNSILNYFKKSPDKPKNNEPKPETSSSRNDVEGESEKAEHAGKKRNYDNPHGDSSSEEYEESWGRPWRKNNAEHKPSERKTPDRETDKLKQKLRSRKKKTRMWRSYSEKDTEDYRKGYPGKKDHSTLTENKRFYFNELPSRPRGDHIDEIHRDWFGNHWLLEDHHGYIQWLFPIREQGMNFHAQELQLHEARAIQSDPLVRKRVRKSYELMLDFYGIQLKDSETGELERADNWKPRFQHLNRSMHNYLRITRILKSLGELGYEHYKPHLVQFILREALEEQTLINCLDSCLDYWVNTIKDDAERSRIKDYAEQFLNDV